MGNKCLTTGNGLLFGDSLDTQLTASGIGFNNVNAIRQVVYGNKNGIGAVGYFYFLLLNLFS